MTRHTNTKYECQYTLTWKKMTTINPSATHVCRTPHRRQRPGLDCEPYPLWLLRWWGWSRSSRSEANRHVPAQRQKYHKLHPQAPSDPQIALQWLPARAPSTNETERKVNIYIISKQLIPWFTVNINNPISRLPRVWNSLQVKQYQHMEKTEIGKTHSLGRKNNT